jgi:hypothetical protein
MTETNTRAAAQLCDLLIVNGHGSDDGREALRSFARRRNCH